MKKKHKLQTRGFFLEEYLKNPDIIANVQTSLDYPVKFLYIDEKEPYCICAIVDMGDRKEIAFYDKRGHVKSDIFISDYGDLLVIDTD